MCCPVVINAKDDAYTISSLTLANKLLIQMCLLPCCAMSEFIQAVALKVIFCMEEDRLKQINHVSNYYPRCPLTQSGTGASKVNWHLF